MSNIYLDTRKQLGLSRADVSSFALRAGHKLATSAIDRLEKAEADSSGVLQTTITDKEGNTKVVPTIGSRGLGDSVIEYINYLYGIGEFGDIDWSSIERGAPVLVHGEEGSWSLSSANDDGTISVFGGKGSTPSFRSFNADRVRLIAPTAMPSEDSAALFESAKRGPRGSNSSYAVNVLGYFDKNPGMAHAIGAIAYALGYDNGLVSRTVAGLEKKGELLKVSRGVFVRGDGVPVVSEEVAAEATPEF